MADNKTTGLLLLGGATALFILPKLAGASENKSSQSGGSGSGLILVPSGFGTGEVSAPLTSLPNVIINEASLPDYNPPAETKKTISSQSTSNNTKLPETKGVSDYRDYNALPDDSPTKKALASQYEPLKTSDGGTIQAPYGLGAGGTGIITPPKVDLNSTTKKEASASSEKKSWWKFW